MGLAPMHVLIITMALDPHADAVIDCLRRHGATIYRINSETLLDDNTFSFRVSDEKWRCEIIDSEGRSISLPDDLQAAYFRKPKPVGAPTKLKGDIAAQDFASSEGEAFLRNLYAHYGMRWVNDPYSIRRAQPKLPQLSLAARFGLAIPPTIVTNRTEEALKFAEQCGWMVAAKTLMTPSLRDGEKSMHFYTKKLNQRDLGNYADTISLAPTLLQQYIEKLYEYRVTVIGQQVFACRLDSQSIEEGAEDWRAADPMNLDHEMVPLPASVEESVRKLVSFYKLEFAAIDLIQARDGRFVFLELNPNGQWYWIEIKTGAPMAEAMARCLLDTCG